MAKETTDATFREDVLEAKGPVLVDFWAPWCGPCRILGPIIENIGKKTEGRVGVYKMNVDENPTTAVQYGITGIPTVIVFRDGKVEREFVGVQPEQVYLNAVSAGTA
ncbi:MAG: thioredoxin [Chitinispirillaceae bacterium]